MVIPCAEGNLNHPSAFEIWFDREQSNLTMAQSVAIGAK